MYIDLYIQSMSEKQVFVSSSCILMTPLFVISLLLNILTVVLEHIQTTTHETALRRLQVCW